MPDHYLSPEGEKKLKQELDYLKKIKRGEISERISKAKDLGDLSENAEYQSAKEEQSFTEGRIAELEYILRNAIPITSSMDKERVCVGSTVMVRTEPKKDELTFTIVGAAEANPLERKISNESPLGQSLLGRKVGEETECITPRGKTKCVILEIQ